MPKSNTAVKKNALDEKAPTTAKSKPTKTTVQKKTPTPRQAPVTTTTTSKKPASKKRTVEQIESEDEDLGDIAIDMRSSDEENEESDDDDDQSVDDSDVEAFPEVSLSSDEDDDENEADEEDIIEDDEEEEEEDEDDYMAGDSLDEADLEEEDEQLARWEDDTTIIVTWGLMMVLEGMLMNTKNVKSCPRLKQTMTAILPQKRYNEWWMYITGLLT